MQRIEKRFPGIMTQAFHPERLADPFKVKKPSKIFVGSSGDSWGAWVTPGWIERVLDVCQENLQHTFLFLTKNPKRYSDFLNLPTNAWYGTTVDGEKRTGENLKILSRFSYSRSRTCFVSFEPLLVPVNPVLTNIQWIIIGANSNRGAPKPPDEWADRIIKVARECESAVWVKDNYRYHTRIKEFPRDCQGKYAC